MIPTIEKTKDVGSLNELNPRIKLASGLELSPEQITELNKIFISVSTNYYSFKNEEEYFLNVYETSPLAILRIGKDGNYLRIELTNPGRHNFTMEVFSENREN